MSLSASKKKNNMFEITRILNHKQMPDGSLTYRVHWKGYRSKFNSWVPEEDMCDCPDVLGAYKTQHNLVPSVTPELFPIGSIFVAPESIFLATYEDVPVPTAEEVALSALQSLSEEGQQQGQQQGQQEGKQEQQQTEQRQQGRRQKRQKRNETS